MAQEAGYIAYTVIALIMTYGVLIWYGIKSWRRLQQQPDVSFLAHMRWLLPETGISSIFWLIGMYMSIPLVVFTPAQWRSVFEVITFIPTLPYYLGFWTAALASSLGVYSHSVWEISFAVGGIIFILLCLSFIIFIEWAFVHRAHKRSLMSGPSQ